MKVSSEFKFVFMYCAISFPDEKLYFISSEITIGEVIKLRNKSEYNPILPDFIGFVHQNPNINIKIIKNIF